MGAPNKILLAAQHWANTVIEYIRENPLSIAMLMLMYNMKIVRPYRYYS